MDLIGFDCDNEMFKLFKLNRINKLTQTDNSYIVQDIPSETLNFNSFYTNKIKGQIIFDIIENDKLLFLFDLTNEDYLIKPESIRLKIIKKLNKSLHIYYVIILLF